MKPKPKPLWVAIDKEDGLPVYVEPTRREILEVLEYHINWQDNFTIIKYIPAKARTK